MGFVRALIFLPLLVGCAVDLPVVLSSGERAAEIAEGEYLEGFFTTTEGDVIDLAGFRDRPVVLIFAQTTCISCFHEAVGLKKHLGTRTPRNVHLIHVMVAAAGDEARQWKDDLRIPWTVGYEEGTDLKTKYCGSLPFPCTVIQMPGEGIGEAHSGAATPDELIATTGEWELE